MQFFLFITCVKMNDFKTFLRTKHCFKEKRGKPNAIFFFRRKKMEKDKNSFSEQNFSIHVENQMDFFFFFKLSKKKSGGKIIILSKTKSDTHFDIMI